MADRVGADPARAVLEVGGGQSSQHPVTASAQAIADGTSSVALVFGSEAIPTVRHLAAGEPRPDFTETRGGQLEDRGYGLSGMVGRYSAAHGLTDATTHYALFENARRARSGRTPEQYARSPPAALRSGRTADRFTIREMIRDLKSRCIMTCRAYRERRGGGGDTSASADHLGSG
ncbi:hypothetical protein [Nocardia aurantia]|uniref:hypothetical protein n=1 Tax=Nocardia aurantia TaxID=2585199 RepID=UPI0018862BEC|nr:hypothetical protein [Nocardia aurantia]